MSTYDAIVLGTGGIGSATLSTLARRGARVLGIDQFSAAHDRGSSHGRTRLIRQAYFEHPDYVPLVLRAYTLWAELAARRGETLLEQTGLVQIGPATGSVLQGVAASAARHGLPIERLTASEIRRRWPGLELAETWEGLYEPQAGVLPVERCVQAYLDDAVAAGALLRTGETVTAIDRAGQDIVVFTHGARYVARRLILTVGPWAARWLADLEVELVVRRKPLFWFGTRTSDYRRDNGFPAFLYETPAGIFYGFPELDTGELKIAEHSGGEIVADPLQVDRNLWPADQARVARFVEDYLPGVSTACRDHCVCMYTMTADENFIVDRHPHDERVAFAAGLSGHGFKFAPALGEALADLALVGRTSLPIDFLNCRRAALH